MPDPPACAKKASRCAAISGLRVYPADVRFPAASVAKLLLPNAVVTPTGRNRWASAAIRAASSCALACVLAALLLLSPCIYPPRRLAPPPITAAINGILYALLN